MKYGNGKGMFMHEITVEMFRNAPLETVEELMASGEVFDIDLQEEIHREKEQSYMQGYEDARRWFPCTEPPKDGRNVFLAHGTNDFKSCCIGHYDQSMELWYEDSNFFARPIYDCKYWCDIPELPNMGDKQFEMPKKESDSE